jgi:hypothetical protein
MKINCVKCGNEMNVDLDEFINLQSKKRFCPICFTEINRKKLTERKNDN